MNKNDFISVNHLSVNHYNNPGIFKQTMTLRQLQETMLYTEGKVLASGYFWSIKFERICPSVYVTWLEKLENI